MLLLLYYKAFFSPLLAPIFPPTRIFALCDLSPEPSLSELTKKVMLGSVGRGEVRVTRAGGGPIFPFLSPPLCPNSDSFGVTEYVEEGNLGLVDDDCDYEANNVSVSFSIGGSRGNSCDGGVGVSGGSSSPSSSSCLSSGLIDSEIGCLPLSEKCSSKVQIKKERIEAVDGFEGGAWGFTNCRNRSFSSSLSACFPKPMEGLHEMGPPPFLKKTFEMVEDPESDPIVSWNQARDSFIVWDSHEFSKTLLPKYFKHGNFSSFIRQLNTYGFRKIGTDRWEFANEWFQGGKKHLLKTIKRRSRYNKRQLISITGLNVAESGADGELETLKKDQNALKEEIMKLRQECEESRNKLTVVEEHIRGAECKQQQMLSFLIKMVKTTSFVHQLMRKRTHKNGVDADEFCKRRRLLPSGGLESSCQTSINACQAIMASQSDLTDISLKPEVLCQHETPFQASINDKSCSFLQGHRAVDTSSSYFVTSEMENPIIDAELMVNESNFYLELEDLVRKPHDWGGYISSHIAQGCVGSMP